MLEVEQLGRCIERGEEQHITPEFSIKNAELLDKIWGYETQVETRVADDTVKRLRKKISKSDAKISTIWGYGFRLVDRTTEEAEDEDDGDNQD